MALQDRLRFASFHEMLKARITTPLGMSNTGTNVPDFINNIPASRSTPGYAINPENMTLTATTYGDMGSLAPAGENISTANDMLKLLAVLTGLNTTSPLTQASLTLIANLGPIPLVSGRGSKMIGYAINIDLTNPNSPTYSKDGSTQGYSAFIIWKTNPQLGVVVLVNKADFHLETLANALIKLL